MSYMAMKEFMQEKCPCEEASALRDEVIEEVKNRINETEQKLEKAYSEVSYWRQRCCRAEEMLTLVDGSGTGINLKDENEKLKEQNEYLRKELLLCQVQLDVVFRIFPERSSCSGV